MHVNVLFKVSRMPSSNVTRLVEEFTLISSIARSRDLHASAIVMAIGSTSS